MNFMKILFSLLFLAGGIYLIYFGFSQPCDVPPTFQEVNGQRIEIQQAAQLDKLICLSTDYVSMIAILIGTAMVFPGIGGLFKGLTETAEPTNGKSKAKNKKK